MAEAALLEMVDLNQQALAQPASADTDRLLRLEHAQHGAHLVDRNVELVRHVLDLDCQIALVIEAADQVFGDGHVLVGQRRAHVHQQLLS